MSTLPEVWHPCHQCDVPGGTPDCSCYGGFRSVDYGRILDGALYWAALYPYGGGSLLLWLDGLLTEALKDTIHDDC